MALEARVPVIPVAMVGTYEIQPVDRSVPKIGRVGIIFGKDKASIFDEDGKCCFYFRDAPICSYGNIEKVGNCTRIPFYWDPESPEIIIKQVHVLKRFSEGKNYTHYDDDHVTLMIKNKSVDDLIYDLKQPLKFKSPKSKTQLLSLRDAFLLKNKESDIFKFYYNGLSSFSKKTRLAAVMVVPSKTYYIE